MPLCQLWSSRYSCQFHFSWCYWHRYEYARATTRITKITPINRVGQPPEIAETVFFLASPGSSFINGENITADGGYINVDVLLKQETSRIREYQGYDYIYKQYENMRKGDTLINIDVCAGYTWIENKEEREFLNKNTLALKNGAIIQSTVSAIQLKEKTY